MFLLNARGAAGCKGKRMKLSRPKVLVLPLPCSVPLDKPQEDAGLAATGLGLRQLAGKTCNRHKAEGVGRRNRP